MGASITIMSILSDRLSAEILQARQRVYTVGEPTPLQRLNLPGIQAPVYAKREDLGPIRAYKWRGAFNCMAALSQEARDKGIVAASAGNHAQGVALAARVLNCHATIFMPRSTPEVKQTEVRRHGGRHVKIMLHGDCYDETAAAAHEYTETHGCTFVHPYDDLVTMAGQGTLADEVVMSGEGPFDRAYVAIGGGGLAASVACWLKKFWPRIKVIGVEGIDQASMKTSIEQGRRVNLDYVDVFCDGTAVHIPGELTYPLCRELVDEFVTVTNNEVCQAIREFSDMPIVMLTAKSEDMDKILGLEYGADDYITKPFNILEVKARIKAIMRRTARKEESAQTAKILVKGNMRIDCESRRVFIGEREINLTAKEYDVLELLAMNPNKVYSRENLLDLVWGVDYPGDARTVDVHIRRLREKIELNPSEPKYVHTKWGVGYYFQG